MCSGLRLSLGDPAWPGRGGDPLRDPDPDSRLLHGEGALSSGHPGSLGLGCRLASQVPSTVSWLVLHPLLKLLQFSFFKEGVHVHLSVGKLA